MQRVPICNEAAWFLDTFSSTKTALYQPLPARKQLLAFSTFILYSRRHSNCLFIDIIYDRKAFSIVNLSTSISDGSFSQDFQTLLGQSQQLEKWHPQNEL